MHTTDEMAGWHHRLDGHGFRWAPGVGDGQGSLACCYSWGPKELNTTERLNWTELIPQKNWKQGLRSICIPVFTTAVSTTAERHSNTSTHWQTVDKWNVVHLCSGASAPRKKEILTRASTWMSLEDTVLSEIKQTPKDKFCMVPPIWGPWSSQIHGDRKQRWGQGLQVRRWGYI